MYLFIYVRKPLIYIVLDETKALFKFLNVCFHPRIVGQDSGLVMPDVLTSV